MTSHRRAPIAIVALLVLVLGAALVAACDRTTQPPDAAPRTAAFWYLWYPETTTGHYTPSAQPYSSDDTTVLQGQVNQMLNAGIQVGIISWFGFGTHDDAQRITAANNAASGTNFRETLYYEPEGVGNPTSAQINSDLNGISVYYAGQSNYLHINGKPVLFVYGDASDNCSTLARWAAAPLAANFYIVQKVFPGYASCANQPDDWHQYGPATATDIQAGHSYTISPGYWKYTDTTPVLGRDLARWCDQATAMAASSEPWHLITTFNEWGEGTGVEPTSQLGTAYLDVLHDALLGGGCTGTTTTGPTTTVPGATTTTVPASAAPCSNQAKVPITHVIVVAFENKTWSDVGGTQFGSMPYLHSLATQCRTFSNYTEVDTGQNSATQYVGATTGTKPASGTADNVLNDCNPDPTSCRATTDNIFRQVRAAGGTTRSYVEGASSTCSASGNAAKHIPALYMYGGTDHSFCSAEVVPFSQFDPNNLPTFAFVTPTLCNDLHDCGLSTGDNWAKTHIGAVLNSAAYKSGSVLVDVWFDEDHPVPNMFLNPAIPAGVDTATAATHFGATRLWEDVLGLPHTGLTATATDLRPALHLN